MIQNKHKQNTLYIVGRWNTTYTQNKYNIHSGQIQHTLRINTTFAQDTLISSRILNIAKNKNIDGPIYSPFTFSKKQIKIPVFGQINTVWRKIFYLDIWTVKNHSPLWDPISGPTARYFGSSVVRQLCSATAL